MTSSGTAAIVAVPTFRRLEQLGRLLPLLVTQTEPLGAVVLVVDNDPAAGARQLVSAWAARGVRYVHEPAPGIAAARNRALAEAVTARVLVFIDDDEVPGPGWLAAILDGWARWGCTAVTGPVAVEYPPGTDRWVLESGVLEQPAREDGALLVGAAANNLLLDVVAVTDLGVRFDDRFGLTGGEDTAFAHALTRRGGSIRWCRDAVVVDALPKERATRTWMLRRTFRAGTTWSRVHLALTADGGVRGGAAVVPRLALLSRGAGRMLIGAARMTRGAVAGRMVDRARGRVAVSSGAGMLLGALGAAPKEYART